MSKGIEYSWRQLGRTTEWYEDMCRCFRYDIEMIARELDLVYTK